MANLTEDEIREIEDRAARRERERCAQLVREFGGLSAREAARRRVPKRGLFFKSVSGWDETVARLHDAVVFTCARLSECILSGLEPLPDPSEKHWETGSPHTRYLKTGGTTGGAARKADKSPAGPTVAEDASPSPAHERGTVGTLDVPAPGTWRPCVECTDLQHCGSWACCAFPDAPRLP